METDRQDNLIDCDYEQECAHNNKSSKPFEVIVKHDNQLDRAYCLGFEHPNSEMILVEYFLPVNGSHFGWAKQGSDSISGCYFQQLVFDETTACRNAISIQYLKDHKFHIPSNTLTDKFGYAYLTCEQEEAFWNKFRNNNKKEKV